MPLPTFSLENRVTALTAKQDRIHVTFGDWILQGTTEEIDRLRNRMGSILLGSRGNSPGTPNPEIYTEDLQWGRIFSRPQQQGTFRAPLKVRRDPLPIGGKVIDRPLFSGRWRLSNYVRSNLELPTTTRTQLELWINPTRYLRHQSPAPMPNPGERGGWPAPQMFGERLSPTIGNEVSYDGNDNWLPTGQRWTKFSSPPFWWRHLSTYLDAIPTTFDEELSRLCRAEAELDGSGCSYRVEPTLNLLLVENFWEFSSENATSLVASLKPLIQAFSRGHRETRVYPHELAEGLEQNALMLTAQVSAGRELRLYAKTRLRVRVEVIHTFGGDDGFRLRGGHTARGGTGEAWERLFPMIGALAEDAAELVNEAFAFFETQNNVTPSHYSSFDLLLAICEHTRDFDTATTITSLLVHHNTVAAGRTNEATRRSLHALSSAGILEHTGQARQTYVVTEPYRHALQTLQQQKENFSLLTARTRRRTIPRG